MLLKNLMEDKQLDFNQPFLSVRRFSSTVTTSEAEVKRKTVNTVPKIPALPAYKSELKSGPIRNPRTIPFVWEQMPERPKNDSKSQTQAPEQPPIVPKLPPGRKSYSCSLFGTLNCTRFQGSKSPLVDPKWKTIVKTLNVHHGHLRFSEELRTPILEA
ncbi:uncharacterized protein LOC123207692 [Mangifera indica]|uniref:uncharacterized protein LOC123207692 n=1 Tax=Mangifera indica TaxID=29780 RepID=UPI001CFB149F|nr:uncharacterized protein LOC123207692 [Mangifera indica]